MDEEGRDRHSAADRVPPVRQVVSAENGGYAYAVAHGDMHVNQQSGPVYLLHEHRRPTAPEEGGPLERPGHLLDARSRVVGFTGRADELADVTAWRDADGPRVSALWVHGPGGQGKTRLAMECADRGLDDGWKVVTAVHGAGAVSTDHAGQDLGLRGARGLLLVVDYADRWPLTHLNWLLSNSLLHAEVPTRLLLLARSTAMWSPVRHSLEKAFHARTRSLALPPVRNGASQREEMFTAARDSFARRYGVSDPSAVPAPARIGDPEFGSVLTLHMAALVAVDAHVHGVRPPEDAVGLSTYLLDREREHWTRLYENAAAGLDYATAPGTMHRSVFTAALTGALPYSQGVTVADRLGFPDPHRLLADHSVCYPPAEPEKVLEPLYPDRFAEDLLAVALPGHGIPEHPPSPWGRHTVDLLVDTAAPDRRPTYLPRALTFLVAAAAPDRWPHVAGHVEDLLGRDPALATSGGGECLAGLALLDLSLETLESVEACFPDHRRIDLDAGIAALGKRIAGERLQRIDDPAEEAREYRLLGLRMSRAGRHEEALVVTERAVDLHRTLAAEDARAHEPELARSLTQSARHHMDLGNWREALSAGEEAVRIHRELPADDMSARASDFATALSQTADLVVLDRRWDDALSHQLEAVRLLRARTVPEGSLEEAELGNALNDLGVLLETLGRWDEAIVVLEEAIGILRRSVELRPGVHEPELARLLNSYASVLHFLRESQESVRWFEEAGQVMRELERVNPEAFAADLAAVLGNLSTTLRRVDRCSEAAALAAESAERYRRLATARPSLYRRRYADALTHQADCLAHRKHWHEAVLVKREAREHFWRAGLEGAIDPTLISRVEAAEHVRRADLLRRDQPSWAPEDHWIMLLDQEEVWKGKDGVVRQISEMDHSHRRNVLRFILSQPQGIFETLIRTESDQPEDWRPDDTPETWLVRRPLVRALDRLVNGGPG